jgi:hypothetical protein
MAVGAATEIDIMTTPQSAPAKTRAARRQWVRPTVRQLRAADAENSINGGMGDNTFTFS